MSNLVQNLDFVQVYLDDILVLTKINPTDHLYEMGLVFECTCVFGLTVDVAKSMSATDSIM